MITGTCIFNTEFYFLDLFNLPYLLTGLNLSLNLSIYFCDTGRHGQISGCLWSIKYSNCFISFWWPISVLYELMPFPSYKMEIWLSAYLKSFTQHSILQNILLHAYFPLKRPAL